MYVCTYSKYIRVGGWVLASRFAVGCELKAFSVCILVYYLSSPTLPLPSLLPLLPFFPLVLPSPPHPPSSTPSPPPYPPHLPSSPPLPPPFLPFLPLPSYIPSPGVELQAKEVSLHLARTLGLHQNILLPQSGSEYTPIHSVHQSHKQLRSSVWCECLCLCMQQTPGQLLPA